MILPKRFTFFFIAMLSTLVACTSVNPYTGQQELDYGATAGVAGLALGATALAVAASKDRPRYRPAYRPYRPRPYRPYRRW